jgi:hypothetical protein
MHNNMSRGATYSHDYIRMTEREKALKQVEKTHKLLAEKQKLVDAGLARWVKIPISKGFKLHFELIQQ